MSNKIDQPVGPATAATPVRPVSRSRGSSSGAVETPSARSDTVDLTGEAQALGRLEQQVQDSTGVDERKVAEMRRILADGNYSADPQAIAARLLQLERSLHA